MKNTSGGKKTGKKPINTWKLNNIILSNQWVNEAPKKK